MSTQFHLLKAKIHRATVTGGDLHDQGSLTIDADLMDGVGAWKPKVIILGDNNSIVGESDL